MYLHVAASSHDSYFLSVFQNTLISEWKTRVDELIMENDFQLRLKNVNYEEQMKDLTDKYIQEIESLEANNEVLNNMNKHVHLYA